MRQPSVSIIIPVYNERDNIRPTTDRLLNALGALAADSEILFVDDNSPDGTAEEVLTLSRSEPRVRLVQHGKKEGIGAAHHAGYHEARGPYVMCLDADLSQAPEDLVRMKDRLDAGYDIVIGSRYAREGVQVGKSFSRHLGSHAMNLICRVLLAIPATDSTHTFRAFRTTVHAAVCPRLDQKGHPSFQIQFLFWAVRMGFRVTEIPIRFTERPGLGESKISVRREVPGFLRLLGRLVVARLTSAKA